MAWTDDQFKKELEQMINRVNEIRKIKWITDDNNNEYSNDKKKNNLNEQINNLSQKVDKIENGQKELAETITPHKAHFPPEFWITIWSIIAVFSICGIALVIKSISINKQEIFEFSFEFIMSKASMLSC